jgi:phosphoribosylanthranilate isomerase
LEPCRIKICGITNVADGLAAAAAGADALGFVFAPESKRRLSLDAAESVARQMPPDVMRVGVFVDASEDEVFAAIQRCGLTMAQFHGAETPEFCGQFGVMTMKAFRIENAASLDPIPDYPVDAILLDSHTPGQRGGTGATFNWELAVAAKKFGKPIFLAGGLTCDNVADAIRLVRPFGVDVSSGVEISAGKKDAEKIRRFIAAVRTTENGKFSA